MNDIRRSILWVIFGFSLVMLWDQWQIHNGRQATFFGRPPAVAPAASNPATPATATGNGVPVPAAKSSNAPAIPPADVEPVAVREKITVQTDVLRLTFDTEGGSLVHAEFLDHAAESGAPKTRNPFVLFDESAQRLYVAQSGLIGGDYPNHKTVMQFSGDRQLREGQDTLRVRFESPAQNGVKLIKTYTLKRGAYDIPVQHEVVNVGSGPVSPQLYVQLMRDGNPLPGESSFYSTFTGPAVYTEQGKFQKVDFSDIDKNKAQFQEKADNGYVAMVQHYFASAWILPSGVQRDVFMRKVDNNLYAVGMIAPLESVSAGSSKAVTPVLFAGPQQEKMLEQIAPGLDLVKDYGWLTILAKPLYWLLDKLHGILGNWGWSIVALVLVIKIAFYWLQAKGYQSMAKMKAINPRVMQLRERFKDNPQQMQQEMMRIYREEKVNPLGGCLPILVQIPVFIALYWVLLSSVEMRNAPWVLWIRDLASPDPLFILPIVMALTTLLQTALNPQPPDPMQAKLMWYMPLIFSVMFFFFPAGLVLYWITNNVLSIAQQWLINTRMGVPPQFNLPKFR
ncbi:membrane protein insertase YidC [Ramlibacter sp. AW1]|uniref:Membrane protein insertase YidC n=1 Tax=Ramlibacter aurantiacus TaxID=2801330 RepID=A0A937D6S8_9BURK|nr:membrane protein insertase YidC [Ramlibacter aurantiacus]MBL0421268.1 membrane protein insertase YidC [Ramlibacter aurantiacus]